MSGQGKAVRKSVVPGSIGDRVKMLREMLAPREAVALELYLRGLSREMMALEMGISAPGVLAYLAKLRGKYAACGLTLKRKLVRAPMFRNSAHEGREA